MQRNVISFRKAFIPLGCESCPAKGLPCVIADAQPPVFEDRVDVLFLGVNPGTQEAKQGIPFCGPAGQLLRRVVGSVLGKYTVAYTNIMLCSTGNEQAIPQSDVCFAKCRRNLRAICVFFKPRIYVPCGNHAMHEVGIEGSISKNQGQVFHKNGAIFIPSLHPSAILRGFASEFALEKTMVAVKKALQGGV